MAEFHLLNYIHPYQITRERELSAESLCHMQLPIVLVAIGYNLIHIRYDLLISCFNSARLGCWFGVELLQLSLGGQEVVDNKITLEILSDFPDIPVFVSPQ